MTTPLSVFTNGILKLTSAAKWRERLELAEANADLAAIAALTPSNDDILQRKAGSWTNRTVAQYLADLGLAPLAAAWTVYTPTVTSGGGTITTLGTVAGRTLKLGRLVHYTVSAAITTNGTGSVSVRFTVPYLCAAMNFYGSGKETGGGKLLQAFVGSSGTTLYTLNADGTYPGADGAVVEASGFYEATA